MHTISFKIRIKNLIKNLVAVDTIYIKTNYCTLLVCDRIYSLLNNDAKYLRVDKTVMILGKLHSVQNIIQTIMDNSS